MGRHLHRRGIAGCIRQRHKSEYHLDVGHGSRCRDYRILYRFAAVLIWATRLKVCEMSASDSLVECPSTPIQQFACFLPSAIRPLALSPVRPFALVAPLPPRCLRHAVSNINHTRALTGCWPTTVVAPKLQRKTTAQCQRTSDHEQISKGAEPPNGENAQNQWRESNR